MPAAPNLSGNDSQDSGSVPRSGDRVTADPTIVDFRVRVPQDTEEFPAFMERYDDLMDLRERNDYGIGDVLASMDDYGVDRAVLHAEFEHGDYVELNDRVARLVDEYPDRFVGFASVDPRDGMAAVDEFERCVTDLGLDGLNLQPFVYDHDPTHRQYYPLYAKCVEHDVPVALHTGINYAERSFEVGRPIHHDRVLCDFPDLTLIALHTGWPWVTEAAAVARKHPSYYLELGGLSPKYLTPENGWAPLLSYADSVLSDQVLFATDYPVMDHDRVLAELADLPLSDDTLEKVLGGNAERLLED